MSKHRARKSSRSEALSDQAIDEVSLWRVVEDYLARLPGAKHEATAPDGTTRREGVYTPHGTVTVALLGSPESAAVR